MANLNLLKPVVKDLALKLIDKSKAAGVDIIITQTLRTHAEQDALYAIGRTKPGSIVTKAKGGYSLHNWGVAFDFCPVAGGKALWSNLALFKKVGKIGQELGLEWGGDWKEFVDLPHFQYCLGYTLEDFRKGKVDWSEFDRKKPDPNAIFAALMEYLKRVKNR